MGEIIALFPPNSAPQLWYTTIAQKYNLPGIFYLDLWPFGPGQMIITDPDAANQVTVLRSFPKHIVNETFLTPLVGRKNIAAVNGPTWKLLHSMLTPAFAPSHVKNLVGMMADETMLFCETLSRHAENDEVFSMRETAAKLIFDIIGKAVFSFPLHAQTTGSACLKDLQEILKYDILGRESNNPLTKLRANIKRKAAIKRADYYVGSKIRERYEYLKCENISVTKKNALSILDLILHDHLQLHSNEKPCSTSGPAPCSALDPEFMDLAVTNIKALLLGGHGTTTNTLCYTYLLLSTHPPVLAQLRAEHDAVFSRDRARTLAQLHAAPHTLNNLAYTTAVIKETLRLFPIGFSLRAADPGVTVNYGRMEHPTCAGMIITPIPHTMHYDPTLFPDPERFDPSRFLRDGGVGRGSWRAFERGTRACMGQDLAVDKLRVVLLLTVREFEFEFAGGSPNRTPRVRWTDLDLRLGDVVFQEQGLEAKPRGGVMMKVGRAEGREA